MLRTLQERNTLAIAHRAVSSDLVDHNISAPEQTLPPTGLARLSREQSVSSPVQVHDGKTGDAD